MPGDQDMAAKVPPAEAAATAVTAGAAPSAETVASETSPVLPPWSRVWQVPALVVSIVMLVWGLSRAERSRGGVDFDGMLAQAEQLFDQGRLEQDSDVLRKLEPEIGHSSSQQQARFHAAAADYLYAAQREQGRSEDEINRRINEDYKIAKESQFALSAARLERWAQTLLALDDFDATNSRLTELKTLEHSANDEKATASIAEFRRGVFRALIEHQIEAANVPFDQLMTSLSDYRLEPGLTAKDEIWAIARQTELRFGARQTQQAIDLLLVEMRRLENRDVPADSAGIGELYELLGRGYFELGDYAKAQSHFEHALTLFAGPELARGEALVYLGQIAVSMGNPDSALDRYRMVVRDFVGTPSYLHGLLGRAEVQSILGSHEASLADYRELCDQMKRSRHPALTPMEVASSLCDRHDATLALGKLDRALDYIKLAEGFFAEDEVPAPVLYRLASTNRQLADNLIAQATAGEADGDTKKPHVIDPAVRHEANVHYELAGGYYIRHAESDSSSTPHSADEASASRWLAADSYDLGGRQDLAIEQFTKYLDMHAIDDPRRAQTLFRLAQAHESRLEYADASKNYEQVIADRGRTSYAAQSYVPLARCYIALKQIPEARQQLKQVLSGNRLVGPDADAYRDALLELGKLDYRENAYADAISELTEFSQRYPGDIRMPSVRFQLADSYRASAMSISDRMKQDEKLSPSETDRLHALSDEQLQQAEQLFAQVVDDARSPAPSNNGQADPDADMIRRAAFYRADCVYYLGQYEHAIDLYDEAARQYSSHQSSMYALIQIVNSYTALGDLERAEAAHHRALVRLKQLPDDAFATPDSLMDRAAWEQWLENNPVTPRTASAVSSGT